MALSQQCSMVCADLMLCVCRPHVCVCVMKPPQGADPSCGVQVVMSVAYPVVATHSRAGLSGRAFMEEGSSRPDKGAADQAVTVPLAAGLSSTGLASTALAWMLWGPTWQRSGTEPTTSLRGRCGLA